MYQQVWQPKLCILPTQIVYMFCIIITQTAMIFLININQLFVVIEEHCVFCEVRTETFYNLSLFYVIIIVCHLLRSIE
jgi:hypothetical protein